MKYFAIFAFFVVLIGFWMNIPKLPIMHKLYQNGKSYQIFPWMYKSNQTKSDSSLIWLITHLFSALMTISFGFFSFIIPFNNMKWVILFSINHAFFSLLIINNIVHFGQMNSFNATLINGFPLFLATIGAFKIDTSFGKKMYFLAITSPILFEFVIYAIHVATIIGQIIHWR